MEARAVLRVEKYLTGHPLFLTISFVIRDTLCRGANQVLEHFFHLPIVKRSVNLFRFLSVESFKSNSVQKSMSYQQQNNKILLAEDNDFVRMQMVRYLTDASYEVHEYTTGQEAAENVDPSYALAILDVRMEPMGGFEFIKSMRSDGLEMPAILVTGDQDPNLLSEASKWNVAAVLMKPVQKERLLKTVEKTLAKAHRGNA